MFFFLLPQIPPAPMSAPNRPSNPNPNPHHRPGALFTGRPLNPNPNPSNPNPKGILYPVSSRPAPPPFTIPTNAVVYARPSGGVVNQHHQLVYVGTEAQRAEFRPSYGVPRPAGQPAQPPLGPTLKGVPIPNHAKVHSLPTVAPTLEYTLAKERERSREERDAFIVSNDRKVRVTDGDASLYSLCRSWVRNGIPREIQSNNGNNERLLPRPLPASFNDPNISNNSEIKDEDDPPEKENESETEEKITTESLLKGHIKRAMKVRARLQKERRIKLRRYKQRLTLLLPQNLS
ncbi:hypothetical protein LUZ60_006078 [Juncus effusus]|nr:hypothetical protein LUZ60_006078 [Juncus effusus]